jgi:hypothetical protein
LPGFDKAAAMCFQDLLGDSVILENGIIGLVLSAISRGQKLDQQMKQICTSYPKGFIAA